MGLKKEFHEWCRFHQICNLFRGDQFLCTHHGGSDQCGKYRELNQKKLCEKCWNKLSEFDD